MINRLQNYDSSTLIPPVLVGAGVMGACFGWVWGFYENIGEVAYWKANGWCGTIVYTTPEVGAILGIILGVCLGIIISLLIFLTCGRERATNLILK